MLLQRISSCETHASNAKLSLDSSDPDCTDITTSIHNTVFPSLLDQCREAMHEQDEIYSQTWTE